MMIQQQQICFSKNFLDKNLCTDPEESFTVVKNLPANVGDTEDAGLIPRPGRPPEEEMTSCCSILAWEIPGKKSLVGYRPWGCRESDRTEQLNTHAQC